jgi:hypothetical protein
MKHHASCLIFMWSRMVYRYRENMMKISTAPWNRVLTFDPTSVTITPSASAYWSSGGAGYGTAGTAVFSPPPACARPASTWKDDANMARAYPGVVQGGCIGVLGRLDHRFVSSLKGLVTNLKSSIPATYVPFCWDEVANDLSYQELLCTTA